MTDCWRRHVLLSLRVEQTLDSVAAKIFPGSRRGRFRFVLQITPRPPNKATTKAEPGLVTQRHGSMYRQPSRYLQGFMNELDDRRSSLSNRNILEHSIKYNNKYLS